MKAEKAEQKIQEPIVNNSGDWEESEKCIQWWPVSNSQSVSQSVADLTEKEKESERLQVN